MLRVGLPGLVKFLPFDRSRSGPVQCARTTKTFHYRFSQGITVDSIFFFHIFCNVEDSGCVFIEKFEGVENRVVQHFFFSLFSEEKFVDRFQS